MASLSPDTPLRHKNEVDERTRIIKQQENKQQQEENKQQREENKQQREENKHDHKRRDRHHTGGEQTQIYLETSAKRRRRMPSSIFPQSRPKRERTIQQKKGQS